MTPSLARWINDADTLHCLEQFRIHRPALRLSHIDSRTDDYYVSLVGDLFERMRSEDTTPEDWRRLGNALSHFAEEHGRFQRYGTISKSEAALYAASAFYFGGLPASALRRFGHTTRTMPRPTHAGPALTCLVGRKGCDPNSAEI
jgi:hypothetical protein